MVSDQEIARGVETVLRQSDPNTVTSLNGVVQQLEAKLGLDLSHKAGFIRDQINSLLLHSHPTAAPASLQQQSLMMPEALRGFVQKDHFALRPQFQQFPSRFAQHQHQHQHQQQQVFSQDLNFRQPHVLLNPNQQQQQQQLLQPLRAAPVELPKESTPVGAKRRGGPGGLNKVCGVSPELQAVVGEPALPRTEIVKQLWAYIRKHNLQDPSNKRKIICDDALRVVFETDCTDMFKMNKLLAKHIIPLDPSKDSGRAKRAKVETKSTPENAEPVSTMLVISDALAKFLGSTVREMEKSEASGRVWEYIRVNGLEDQLNSMVINCDPKLQELLGCESISAVGVDEMLARRHLFKRS